MIQLTLVNQSRYRMPRRFLSNWVKQTEKALRQCGVEIPRRCELSVVFLNADEALALNRQYRSRDYATDVLSFQNEEPLGDLVLCPEVLERQAVEHQLSVNQELGYMVIHGILHLLGFDHEKTKKEARVMFQLQDAVFQRLLSLQERPRRRA